MRKRIFPVTLAVASLIAVGAGAAHAANGGGPGNNSRRGGNSSSVPSNNQGGNTGGNTGGTSTAAGPFVLCSNAGAIYAYVGQCPTGYTLETKASLTGPQGQQGIQGIQGLPGTDGQSAFANASTTVPFTAATPVSRTITVSGLPAYDGSVEKYFVNDQTLAAGGTVTVNGVPASVDGKVHVTSIPPAAGDKTRKFTVLLDAPGFGQTTPNFSITISARVTL
jgi:hypothetical protein